MARPKKTVANTDETMKQFLEEIKDIYLNPPANIAELACRRIFNDSD